MSHIQNIVETGKNDFEDGDKIVFKKGSIGHGQKKLQRGR